MSDKNPGAPKNLRKQDRTAAVARTQRNSIRRAQRHQRRLDAQALKRPWGEDGMAPTRDDLKVPRGTARAERRKPLQEAYAKRTAIAARLDAKVAA